ncbi:EamA family transporter [Gleimia hominis]|uniref:EamA family transporter n=1 Tax=Gleimia hominis TaxID=595468 RepID=A0ABU3I8H7_9ACTO|nr:EamA family transporter [Gleimia hominis]MDT3766488.1 EamA family transporter [Gleimia hominis]
MKSRIQLTANTAPLLLIGSGLTQYVGAALAIVLFTQVTPAAVAWWRVAVAATVFILWRRPWRMRLSRVDWGRSALFGVVMTLMNVLFYEAISRIALGVAVSLEFLGPVAVAVMGSKHWTSRVAAVAALAGVVSISGFGVNVQDPKTALGIIFALGAGACWAGYIVLGQRIASQRSGIDSLAIGTLAGAVVFLPFCVTQIPKVVASPVLIGAVLGVGLLSTVVPYSLEALAMSKVHASVFALLTALLPATSLLVGAVALQQFPAWPSVAGLILISLAVAVASRDTTQGAQNAREVIENAEGISD